jgi:hypothetical protein
MNPYLNYVESIEEGVTKAKELVVLGKKECILSASKVLFF